ncbi:MAG: DUF3078 domain-containing protein [Porphyromonadaceae bacterium]|nr:DUF3078 domain-containing protein [Porphyromonadaceae bacterium]
MKRLPPKILISFLFAAVTATVSATHITSANFQDPDSLELFRDITDISGQIEKQTLSSDYPQEVDLQQPVIVPQNQDNLFPENVTIKPLLPAGDSVAYRNPLDLLYVRKENGTLHLPARSYNFDAMRGLTFRDTLIYNPLFLPMIFNGKVLPRDLSFYPPKADNGTGSLISPDKTFAPALAHADFVQQVRKNYYMEYPDRIRYSVLNFNDLPRVASGDEIVRETFNPFRELLKSETTYSLEAPGVEVATINRKYWVRSGEHSFQFAQNYFSENWHKGGTNNLNFNSYQVLRANYNKEKIKFNNTLEWRLSVFNAPDDTLRRYRIGNDLIRYYGDFGVDAFMKGWSYSMNVEAKSQLFNSYPPNSDVLRSAFLAPLYVNAGVGLKFNLDKRSEKVRHRRFRWDLSIAPISINYKFVGNDSVDVKRYGIPENKRSVFDFGSTITSIIKYDITRYITWDSRLTYFTSYKKVLSEFENSLNMALSNAFSTRIYVNMRFDDDVPPHPDLKYWQINQTLSFGLNYKW